MSESILEPQHDLLLFLFNNLKDTLLVFDKEGQLLHGNEALLNLLHLDNKEDLLNLSLFDNFQLTQDFIKSIKTNDYTELSYIFNREQFFIENKLKTIDGFDFNRVKIPINLNAIIRFVQNKYYLVKVTFESRPKHYDFMIQEDQLSLALSAANISMWDWNLIDNTIHFSKNFYSWFDYDLRFINKYAASIYSIVHPDDRESLQKEIDNNIHNNANNFFPEFRMRQNEQDYIWVRASGRYITNSMTKVAHFSGIILNITSQKQSSIELESERNDMNNLFNNMSTGFALHKILVDDLGKPNDYEYIYVNPSYESLTGLKTDHIIGQRVLDIIPDLEHSFIETYGDIALNGGSTQFTQYSAPLKKYFDIIAYQTEPGYFAVIFSDVTESIRAEKALSQADKMNSIGQLAGGIAHDFNNHLQIIRGYSEMTEAKLKDLGIKDCEEYLDKIHLSVKHSSNMIKQLLAFSKDDHYIGKPMDFHLMLHQTKNVLSYTINRNIPIQLLLEAKSYQIIGDDSLLQNTIINMCLNSRDALPNGGLILIMTRNIHYDKATYVGTNRLNPGEYIICSIRDNGEGILPEDLRRIFEPFYTTKLNKGTGMGLAAVYGTIKHHQGTINVSSEYGEWTQFDIYLPVSKETVNYTYTHKDNLVESFTPYSILLVDDEPVITMVMEQFLTELGHRVTVYNSPNVVLSEFNNLDEQFDVVLLDVIMPEMNGFDLLEELITLKPDVKAIFLSGYFNTNDIKEHMKPHILDYIEKPVNLTKLGDKIQRLLNKT